MVVIPFVFRRVTSRGTVFLVLGISKDSLQIEFARRLLKLRGIVQEKYTIKSTDFKGGLAMELVMAALKSQKASVDAYAATDAIISISKEIEPARKRRASTEVGIRNSWGIRNMDSILGNSHLAVKWSLRSMTATDRKNVTDDGFLETTRTAGSQVKLNAKKQKVKDLEEQFSRLEENLQNAETEAYGARKKNKELEAKLVMVVPAFLQSTTYKGCLHAFAQSRVPETYTAYFTHIVGEIERVAPYFNT
ncbi:hypothetical protein OROHE_015039 [Orobanche hederae]